MSTTSSSGIGIGTVVAAILSWNMWHSLGWTILHAFCGWFYVIYYLITYYGDK